MQTLSFVPINLHGRWPRESKLSIELGVPKLMSDCPGQIEI